MAKINFSKVEDALTEGLRKMNVNELGKLAEISQSFGRPELVKLAEAALTTAAKKGMERKAMLHVLRQGSKKITDDEFYAEFTLTFDEFVKLIEKGKVLTEDDWHKLDLVRAKMLSIKEQNIKSHPELGNEKLVEKTRKDQINARINIRKTWLPLQ